MALEIAQASLDLLTIPEKQPSPLSKKQLSSFDGLLKTSTRIPPTYEEHAQHKKKLQAQKELMNEMRKDFLKEIALLREGVRWFAMRVLDCTLH